MRAAPPTVPLHLRAAPPTVPLAGLAEPTEAPPPWDGPSWPSAPPTWHTSLPPSSRWTDEEWEDVEYVDPLKRRSRLPVPESVRWCLGALVIGFLGRVLIYQADWAGGLVTAALVAGMLAVIAVLVGAIGCVVAWRLRAGAFALATGLLVFAVLLAADGTLSQAHMIQAAFAERSAQWDQAVREYERSAASPAWVAAQVARVNLSWGNAALTDGNYATAITHYDEALANHNATRAQQAQAHLGEVRAYEGWIAAGGSNLSYVTALTILGAYSQDKACDASCQGALTAAEAQAFYEYGTQLDQQGDSADALVMFQTVGQRFPTSAVAAQAHVAAASVLVSEFQEIEPVSCPSGVPLLRQLASGYGDTPEGAQAKKTLTAPVIVHGTMRGLPYPTSATMYLIPQAQAQRGNYTPAYTTTPDVIGDFTFLSVRPGTYILGVRDGGGLFTWASPDASINVTPLCQVSLPSYTYP